MGCISATADLRHYKSRKQRPHVKGQPEKDETVVWQSYKKV